MGRCLDEGAITLAGGIINTFADILVTIIPIPLIAKLQLPIRRRIGAIILVSLGFIVCIAGAVRAYYTWLSLISSYDQTWYCYGVWISAAIEIDLGVVSCISATAQLKELIQQYTNYDANRYAPVPRHCVWFLLNSPLHGLQPFLAISLTCLHSIQTLLRTWRQQGVPRLILNLESSLARFLISDNLRPQHRYCGRQNLW